jgi:hypothetical protein
MFFSQVILWRWLAKLVARLLATAALGVRIQTSLKNTKWATSAKEWPTHSSPPKKYKKILLCLREPLEEHE